MKFSFDVFRCLRYLKKSFIDGHFVDLFSAFGDFQRCFIFICDGKF